MEDCNDSEHDRHGVRPWQNKDSPGTSVSSGSQSESSDDTSDSSLYFGIGFVCGQIRFYINYYGQSLRRAIKQSSKTTVLKYLLHNDFHFSILSNLFPNTLKYKSFGLFQQRVTNQELI